MGKAVPPWGQNPLPTLLRSRWGDEQGGLRAGRAGPAGEHPFPPPLCRGRQGQPGLGAARGRMEDEEGPDCGKPDFVLLDQVTMEDFMENLKLR